MFTYCIRYILRNLNYIFPLQDILLYLLIWVLFGRLCMWQTDFSLAFFLRIRVTCFHRGKTFRPSPSADVWGANTGNLTDTLLVFSERFSSKKAEAAARVCLCNEIKLLIHIILCKDSQLSVTSCLWSIEGQYDSITCKAVSLTLTTEFH